MRRFTIRLFLGFFALSLPFASSVAFAGDPCGNIDSFVSGNCQAQFTGGCVANCTPLNFVAACDGQCTAGASVDCTGGCEADCSATCEVDPPSFDCEGSCSETCKADCNTWCSDSSCVTECQGSCDNRCKVSCTATPGSATCTAKCQARCDASCQVKANVDCHVKCSADLKGGCDLQCSQPSGALFCDGQYVDVGNSFDSCISHLTDIGFSIDVTGAVACSGSHCTAKAACSTSPGSSGDPLGVLGVTGLLVGVGLIASRRRRA